ncbi:MAG: hypothetical protein ACOYM9_16705 [Bradymonadia bacterium]
MSVRLAGIVGLVALGCAGSPGGGGTSDATPGASPPPSASPTGPGSSVPSRPADAGFSRPLPDTTDRIAVFPDQLGPGLSDAQIRFVAERMVGSQKLPRSTSARIRAVNPGFVVLQYRLAYGLSTAANLIETDTWGPTHCPRPVRLIRVGQTKPTICTTPPTRRIVCGTRTSTPSPMCATPRGTWPTRPKSCAGCR